MPAIGIRQNRRGMWMGWITSMLAAAAMAGTGSLPTPLITPASLNAIVQPHVWDKSFMGQVLVAKGDTILFDRFYGRANLEWDVAFAPDTRFRIGSMTKQFTAAAVMKLLAEKKVALDAVASTYVTDLPATWSNVTVRQLLDQTAGLPNYTSDQRFPVVSRQPTKPHDLIALVADKGPEFTPGSEWRYSNTNYLVLGKLIENVSGKPYAAFLRETLFAPLGMKGTEFDSVNRIIPHRAAGYGKDANTLSNANYTDESVPFSAGGLVATGRDLLTWERALFRGRILSPQDSKL
ncbi:MAG: beta-lactamase family protein, partial [Acidobacteriales bacterium]|nr:beta-lactamase family protein [Terriglobales bacterium]